VKWLKHLIWKTVTQDPNYAEVQVPCPEIVLEQIDGELYAKLLAQATAAGAQFNGTEVTFKGCTFDWLYTAEECTLHVTCTSKPFYFSCNLIQSQIEDLIQKAKEGI
jgi:hypothetical protein